jgi:hypothetical protein
MKRLTIRILIGTAVSWGLLAAVVLYYRDTERRGAELEQLIVKMPLDIPASEAVSQLGRSPDQTHSEFGVLATPNTFLTASNSRAAGYGPPQEYTLYTWRRGNMNATVAVDGAGKVAGHWTWR